MKKTSLVLVACLLGALSHGALAQAYPSKTVHIVEPVGPGSAPDVFARKLTPGLGDKWGQSVVVDNRPGGNSSLGAREAADYRDQYQKLTGQSLRDCPRCGIGHMLVIDTFPVASLSRARPPDTS